MASDPLTRRPPLLTLDGTTPTLGSLRLTYGQDQGTRAEVVLAEELPPPKVDAPVDLEVGGLKLSLEVDDYQLPRAQRGGRLSLADALVRAKPYRLDVFSGPRGASMADAIRSRVSSVKAPPALAGVRHPTIAVDGTLLELLAHVCAGENGWHFWFAPGGLEIGPSRKPACRHVLDLIEDVTAGVLARITSTPLPAPGSPVNEKGITGVVLRAEVSYQADQYLTCIATIGQPQVPGDCPPRASRIVDAVIKQKSPLLAEVEVNGRRFPVRVQTRYRKGGGEKFRETLPLDPGDRGQVLLPCGGVFTGTADFYPFDVLDPTPAFKVDAETRVDRVKSWQVEVDQINVKADAIQITADDIETRVKQFRIDEK